MIRALFLTFFTCFWLYGCQPSTYSQDTFRDVEQQQVKLRYSPALFHTETPLQLAIQGPKDWQLQHAQLVAQNMQMATLPLFIRQQNSGWQADFILGACSEPTMRWQLQLEWLDHNGQPIQTTDLFEVVR